MNPLLQLCFRLPAWHLAQGAFALVLRVLTKLKKLKPADEVAHSFMPDEVTAGRLPGALMLQLLVKVAHTDDSASPFSDKAREVMLSLTLYNALSDSLSDTASRCAGRGLLPRLI